MLLEWIRRRVLVGYDIGCTFKETVAASSLGNRFKESGSRFCVNAFHGYSHNYQCQVCNHPNCIAGIGIEDLETLERIFSASNKLAPVIRYASPFRRLIFIDLFFTQWDREKYANIGLMLYNNYRQALEIIKDESSLRNTLSDLKITDHDIRRYQIEEREYFINLRDEDTKNLHAIAYVEALQDLQTAQYV